MGLLGTVNITVIPFKVTVQGGSGLEKKRFRIDITAIVTVTSFKEKHNMNGTSEG